ncbi:MAG: carbonic anhydrase [Balneolales bacterium]|nr:carbonic anhydrase [Balneolales bacterium]
MRIVDKLIEKNRDWVSKMNESNPNFFDGLKNQQHPEVLWIGCSDSRVSSNVITGMMPGDIFVHRNVANMVVSTDFNLLSVLQYAVDYLQVKCIIVCGHYNCGGVIAAYHSRQLGLIDNWLNPIRDVYFMNKKELSSFEDEGERINRLCELNVKQQVHNVCHTTIVQNAWDRGQELSICGLIYDVANGLLKDLKEVHNSTRNIPSIYVVDSPET